MRGTGLQITAIADIINKIDLLKHDIDCNRGFHADDKAFCTGIHDRCGIGNEFININIISAEDKNEAAGEHASKRNVFQNGSQKLVAALSGDAFAWIVNIDVFSRQNGALR